MAINVLLAVLFAATTAAAQPPGPSVDIACPADSLSISPDQDIAAVVAKAAPGAAFCVRPGRYTPVSPINLKARQRLIGEYGAILDGANVRQEWDSPSMAIVRGWNCPVDCSGVLVQNLVIQNLPAYTCVGVYGSKTAAADGWTIDHNDISGCRWGVNIGYNDNTRITNNLIHHNTRSSETSGGYGANYARNALFFQNDIAFNGREQKVVSTTGTTFRANLVRNNLGAGVWFDGDNTKGVAESNTVLDNDGEGIFYEISADGVIRNNVIRRSGRAGIYLSTSQRVEVYGNTLDDNFRGIAYFVRCTAVYPPGKPHQEALGWDLNRLTTRDNVVIVGAQPGVLANYLGHSECTPEQLEAYVGGGKALKFDHNTYYVPSLAGRYWAWGGNALTFTDWKKSGQDGAGVTHVGRPK
jgi:parallel beta-helix repeat protein